MPKMYANKGTQSSLNWFRCRMMRRFRFPIQIEFERVDQITETIVQTNFRLEEKMRRCRKVIVDFLLRRQDDASEKDAPASPKILYSGQAFGLSQDIGREVDRLILEKAVEIAKEDWPVEGQIAGCSHPNVVNVTEEHVQRACKVLGVKHDLRR